MRHAGGRLDAPADHVADHEADPAVAKRNRVVPVAADAGLARTGQVARGEAKARNVGQPLAQQASLEGFGCGSLDLDLFGRPPQAFEGGAQDRVAARIGGPAVRQVRPFAFSPPTLSHSCAILDAEVA